MLVILSISDLDKILIQEEMIRLSCLQHIRDEMKKTWFKKVKKCLKEKFTSLHVIIQKKLVVLIH